MRGGRRGINQTSSFMLFKNSFSYCSIFSSTPAKEKQKKKEEEKSNPRPLYPLSVVQCASKCANQDDSG